MSKSKYNSWATVKKKVFQRKIYYNGSSLKPCSFNDNVYALENTSVFDCLLELVGFAFKNINDFRKYYDNFICTEELCFLKNRIWVVQKGESHYYLQ